MARTTNEKVNTHLQAALDSLEREKATIEEQIKAIRSVLGQATSAAAVKVAAVVASEGEAPAGAESGGRRRRRRKLSAEARARIAAAQKKRWSEFRKSKEG